MASPTSIQPAGADVLRLDDYRIPSYRRRCQPATPTPIGTSGSTSLWVSQARQRAHVSLATTPHGALRVTHYPEAANASQPAGSLRISGRLADVCAELERLAAAEARLNRA